MLNEEELEEITNFEDDRDTSLYTFEEKDKVLSVESKEDDFQTSIDSVDLENMGVTPDEVVAYGMTANLVYQSQSLRELIKNRHDEYIRNREI